MKYVWNFVVQTKSWVVIIWLKKKRKKEKRKKEVKLRLLWFIYSSGRIRKPDPLFQAQNGPQKKKKKNNGRFFVIRTIKISKNKKKKIVGLRNLSVPRVMLHIIPLSSFCPFKCDVALKITIEFMIDHY
jgi:hypothetical protein